MASSWDEARVVGHTALFSENRAMDPSPSGYVLASTATLHAQIEIKRSRFLARVERVTSAADARGIVAAECERYPDARHHCAAFVVSVPHAQPILHSSDDGEPAGTAGRPILDTLTGVPLTDTVAVVTRYFGGTLLGTGGLVRAYSDAVRTCIEGAHLAIRLAVPRYVMRFPHAIAGRYLAHFAALGWDASPEYSSSFVTVTVSTRDDVAARIAALSSGSISAEYLGDETIDQPCGIIRDGQAVICDSSPTH